ncbi:hypothetical protein MLD38_032026 [Melastoma candidum]|uniref:Uncharacterized protein n=1 Tax=Melastoma candidum TaxID=119954 RepID=A0ACB9MSU8_9MYRT|nr:hypothetical protein MLD38_032026 [Melastoma candidum]
MPIPPNAIKGQKCEAGLSPQSKAWPQQASLLADTTPTVTQSMRRTSTPTPTHRHEAKDNDLEIVKAVAQAWHSRSSSSSRDASAASEFDARRLNFQGRPSRFKIEATRKANQVKSLAMVKYTDSDPNLPWDFSQSLWDSYEIVAVSKRLETALVFDGSYAGIDELDRGVVEQCRVVRRKRESRNSLRNLFNLMSSRRFKSPESPQDGTT